MTNYGNILSLARAGATSQAWKSFVAAGLAEVTDNPAALSLKGRLLKDQARKAKSRTSARLYLESAKAYADAAALRPDSYPLINAATMSLFAGQADHMALLAQRVLEMLDTGSGVGETPYWHDATRAEALLLLDRQAEAKAALDKAIVAAATAWEDRAATLRQFREILQFRDEPSDWLANYAPPASLYFKGLIGVASDDARAAELARVAVNEPHAGFGYGALAAGADILIAEALVERGAELHLVLPLSFRAFRAQSVEPFGAAWLPRFDRLLEQAASVIPIADSERLTNAAIALAVMVAKGAAIENAKRLEGIASGLELNDRPSPGFDAASDRFIALERTAPTAPSDLAKGMINITVVSDYVGNDPAGLIPIGDGFHARHTGSLAATIAWLVDLRRVTPDARAALKISAYDSAAHFNNDSSVKLLRLAQCADPGTTIADSISARALLSETPHLRTEPLGELADALGAMEIYAIDPLA
jgi:hypothetical protein